MKSKGLFRFALSLLLIAIITFIVGGVMLNFDYSYMNMSNIDESKLATENYEASDDIKINSKMPIVIKQADIEEITFSYYSESNVQVALTDGVYTITGEAFNFKWYQYLFNHFLWKYSVVYITIPTKTYNSISVEASVGSVELNDFSSNSIDIYCKVGSIEVNHSNAQSILVKTDTGSITIDEGTYLELVSETNVGSCDLKKVTSSSIHVVTDTGSITARINGDKNDYQIEVKKGVGSSNIESKNEGTKKSYFETSVGSIDVAFK